LSALRRKPAAAAALVYALLAVALYAPALLPGHTLSASDYLWSAAPWSAERPADVRPFGSNYELVDSAVQFQPWLQYTRDRLPDFPLWNPQIGLGRPYFANAQSALFSPFSLPAYVLPFWWSLGLIAVLKVFCAAFGTYLLARALGMRFGGALMAGLVYAFCLYLVVWISWPQTNVWALLPWVLLLVELTLRRPEPLCAAGLAGLVALQFFGGHPESNFHLLAAAGVFFAFRLWALRSAGELPALRRPVLAVAAGVVGGTALAAVLLVPFLELLLRSSDVDIRQDFAQIALPKRYLLGFALPDYWGRATHTAVEAFAQERALYFGALPLVLAAAALIVRPTRTRVAVAVFAAFLLAVVLGVPPLPDLAAHIPIVKTGNHLRVVFILMLCVALLAGWGLDDLAGDAQRRRTAILVLAGAALALPVLILLARGDISPGLIPDALEVAVNRSWPAPPLTADGLSAIRMGSLVPWLVFMGLGLLLLAARLHGRLAPSAFVALAIALVALDLFKAGMGATPAISTEQATQPATPAIEYLRSRGFDRFVGLERAFGPSPLVPNMAMRWSLFDARSYDLPVDSRHDRLWRRSVREGGPTDTPTTSAKLTPQSLPALRLLSVTGIAQDPSEPVVTNLRLPVSYDRRDLRIYATPRPLPRAGVVGSQVVEPSEGAQLDAVLRPGFDGRSTVVAERPLPGLRTGTGSAPAGRARIVQYDPERVVVEATAERPAELVLTDLWYPGWKVEVDGRETDLHRVNYLLRGASLSPGRHRVQFSYEPLSFRVGALVSLVALLGLIAAVVAGIRRRRA
jgi:hypothetical protein